MNFHSGSNPAGGRAILSSFCIPYKKNKVYGTPRSVGFRAPLSTFVFGASGQTRAVHAAGQPTARGVSRPARRSRQPLMHDDATAVRRRNRNNEMDWSNSRRFEACHPMTKAGSLRTDMPRLRKAASQLSATGGQSKPISLPVCRRLRLC